MLMSKGVIDGAIFNYEGSESFGLGTVTRDVMEPFLTTTLVLVMNAGRYDALPADLRAIIDETTGPAAAALGTRWDGAEAHGRDYMLANKVAISCRGYSTAKASMGLCPTPHCEKVVLSTPFAKGSKGQRPFAGLGGAQP